MHRYQHRVFAYYLFVLFAAVQVRAEHGDILVQDVDGQLTLGSANLEQSAYELGTRIFTVELPVDLTTDEPGWNALPSSSPFLPPGAGGLPGTTDLAWDFVPMTSTGGISTLLYWNGDEQSPAGVDFTPAVGANTSLSLFGVDGLSAAADGGAEVVPGAVIGRTDSVGALHRHRFFFLDDGDGNPATQPPAGIYLTALRLRMEGLETSDPFYVLFATPEVRHEAMEDVAEPWVESRLDFLACVDGCPGGLQDGLAAWQRGFGLLEDAMLSDGDANRDGAVDGADFLAIQAPGRAGAAIAAIPEPATLWTSGIGCLVAALSRRRRALNASGSVIARPLADC